MHSKAKTIIIFAALVLFAMTGYVLLFNTHAATSPTLGLYRGAAGTSSTGPAGIGQASTWLGRDVMLGEDFNADQQWSDVEGQSWQLNPWGQWVSAKAGRTLAFAVSPFPKSGGSLAECATGAYNSHWQKLGQNLVNYKLANTYIRFGHEMNGDFYTWTITGGKQADYIGCYQQFVNTMRKTTGQSFKFVWNPNGGGYSSIDLSTAYPGDAYVDFIGPDAYDQSWATNTYPYPSTCDAACKLTHQQNAWNSILTAQNAGLNWFVTFAKTHNKPLVIPEWGDTSRPDGHGGMDDAYYIEQMTNFINNPNNNVAWHSYFDFTSADGGRQLSPVPSTYVTPFVLAAAKFKSLYSTTTATPLADTTIPTVSITSPSGGSTVTGTANISVNASDNVGVTKLEYYVDNTLLQSGTGSSYSWNTLSVGNGSHTLMAKAYDAAGNSNSQSQTVTVSNNVADTTPPTISILTPLAGASIKGDIAVQANASDNQGVTKVEFYIDDALKSTENAAPYCMAGDTSSICNVWQSTTVADGQHTLKAKAYDAAGNSQTASVIIYVQNQTASDTTPPSVTIASPASGSKVGKKVTVSAKATDNVSVVWLEVKIDGVTYASGASDSLSFTWNSAPKSIPAGAHTLTATAKDAAGNAKSSSITLFK